MYQQVMLPSLMILLHCADSIDVKTYQSLQFQARCVHKLLQIRDDEVRYALTSRMLLRSTTILEDVCTWAGIRCAGGFVHEIAWGTYFCMHKSYNLNWFPPTTRKVHIDDKSLVFTELHPEFLPRAIETFAMNRCCLIGWLDLRHLPKRMASLFLRGNCFAGHVDLTALPKSIRCIDLVNNSFGDAIVIKAALPHDLLEVRLGYVKVRWLDGEVDRRIRTEGNGWM